MVIKSYTIENIINNEQYFLKLPSNFFVKTTFAQTTTNFIKIP